MQRQRKKLTRAEYDARIELLSDRLALSLVILKQRYGDNWEPWFGEHMWEHPDGMCEELRGWSEYSVAREVVELFITRSERNGGNVTNTTKPQGSAEARV